MHSVKGGIMHSVKGGIMHSDEAGHACVSPIYIGLNHNGRRVPGLGVPF